MRVAIHETSTYAPIRYEATRPYARWLGRLFMAHAHKGEASRLRFVQNELLLRLHDELGFLGRTDGPGPVQGEVNNVQTFGQFDAGGRVIFDVAHPLTQSLLVTDAEDIPCSELVFPAERFYLHFGRGTGLKDDGDEIEGAFVEHQKGLLFVDLVPASFGRALFFTLPMGEQLVGVRVDLSEGSRTIMSALERSIADTLAANRAVFDQMRDVEARLTAEHREVVKVPSSVERLDENGPLLRTALKLIVNTLFFLAAEPSDVHEGWGADAPKVLAEQAQDFAAKPGTRKTAENTLTKRGYVKVRYVGRQYGALRDAGQVSEAVATGRVLATHIRRGHFRSQPYGPERALRKRIFVAPVVVNADRAEDSPGRIYEA